MTLRTVDLFAGCGGLSLGFQKEKYNIVAAFELWDAAVKCYKENFSHSVYQTDLSNVDEAVKIILLLEALRVKTFPMLEKELKQIEQV